MESLHALRSAAAPASSQLSSVNCQDFHAPATAPSTRINLGPGQAPMGRRSLGLVPAGPGTATGPSIQFSSLASITASTQAFSARGTSGVSYVWVMTADAPSGTAWMGRSDTSVAPGVWQSLSAADQAFTWRQINLDTHAVLAEGGNSTPAQFAAAHGDGSGYVVLGLGCDGAEFNLDAVRSAAGAVDFEGLSVTTTIAASAARVAAGQEVTVTGRVVDASGRALGDPLDLQRRRPDGSWETLQAGLLVGPDGVTAAQVKVSESSVFRWAHPESEYADVGWSAEVSVEATPAT